MRCFHGCCSIGDDTFGGINHRKQGAANTLAALKSIRAARPDGTPIYAILDNLSAHKGAGIRRWAKKNEVELCFTPTYASWASPNAKAGHRDVLAAERRERARTRSEKGTRRGGRPLKSAA